MNKCMKMNRNQDKNKMEISQKTKTGLKQAHLIHRKEVILTNKDMLSLKNKKFKM